MCYVTDNSIFICHRLFFEALIEKLICLYQMEKRWLIGKCHHSLLISLNLNINLAQNEIF